MNRSSLSTNHYPLTTQSAFTLIEVLVVMGLLALIAALGLIFSLDDYRAYLFRGERDLVISVLQRARSQATSNVCLGSNCTDGKAHGVHFENGKYVIFQGANFNSGDSTNQTIEANSTVAVTPSSPEIIFSQLSGQVSSDWTATLTDQFGRTLTIRVNREGQIDW